MMKRKAVIINTARGPVIDEPALIKALQERWIAGAGLDVFEKEPCDPANPLLAMDNVVVTPHTSGLSEAAAESSVPAHRRGGADTERPAATPGAFINRELWLGGQRPATERPSDAQHL